jgi:hypothetical protein
VATEQTTPEIVLDEIHRVLAAQLSSYQSLGERAATMLSVLTGFATATLTVETVVSRPPVWTIAIPSALLLIALAFAVQALQADAVWIGPEPASLASNQNEPTGDLRKGLIDFYTGIIVDNRLSLKTRARYVELATWFLVFAIGAVILLGVALYL